MDEQVLRASRPDFSVGVLEAGGEERSEQRVSLIGRGSATREQLPRSAAETASVCQWWTSSLAPSQAGIGWGELAGPGAEGSIPNLAESDISHRVSLYPPCTSIPCPVHPGNPFPTGGPGPVLTPSFSASIVWLSLTMHSLSLLHPLSLPLHLYPSLPDVPSHAWKSSWSPPWLQ
jgi:hypothetical protein